MRAWLQRLFDVKPMRPRLPVSPGLRHFIREAGGGAVRFHLRVEPDGHGLLLANASAAARLSPTGAVMALGLLESRSEAEILDRVRASFSVSDTSAIRRDLAELRDVIDRLSEPGDNYPIVNLDDARFSPYAARLMAPYGASVVPGGPETNAAIVQRLWAAGVPHVVWHPPEPVAAEVLTAALERAEDTGLIAGVRARAGALTGALLEELAVAGLDHLTVPMIPAPEGLHDRLLGDGDLDAALLLAGRAADRELCFVAEIPILDASLPHLEETLGLLAERGVTNAVIWALASVEPEDGPLSADSLPQAAVLVEELSDQAEVRYLWLPPARWDASRPLGRQIAEGPRCQGEATIRVEADGAVIPPRGPRRSAGNLLTDPWEAIWGHEAFRMYRERMREPEPCAACPGVPACAAGCVREPAGWAG